MEPVHFREDAVGRRWLAAHAMRRPLVALKFVSPLLVIAALTIIVSQPNLAAQPLDVLYVMALPFGTPFLLAAIYPVVRWMPQRWTLDAAGIHGRGRVGGACPWSALAEWSLAASDGLANGALVRFRRVPTWRHRPVAMMVPAAERDRVEAWLRAAAPAAELRAP
jgi:hypothetical protein